MTELLTLTELAKYLKLSRTATYRLLASGDLPPAIVLRQGKREAIRRWRATDVEAFLQQRLGGTSPTTSMGDVLEQIQAGIAAGLAQGGAR